MKLKPLLLTSLFAPLCFFSTSQTQAADWSTTEVFYKHGVLKAPTFASGKDASTNIFTLQHASGWSWGDVFFFVDALNDNRNDDFNDHDLYGELYLNFSLGKLTGKPVTWGAVKDIGLIAGFGADKDAKTRKYMPGIRLSWDVPGFAFLNSDLMAYIDDDAGVKHGGAPKESNSYIIDINGAYPINIGAQSFSIEGHMEYVGSRHNEFGGNVSNWILAQPQFRWDAGKALAGKANKLFLGVEYQYWYHKLGDERTTEHRPQFLAVWRL